MWVSSLCSRVLGACSGARSEDRIPETRPRSRRQPAAGRCRRTRHDELPFPRSLMPKFRAVDAGELDKRILPGSLWQCYPLHGRQNSSAEARNTRQLGWRAYNIIKGRDDLGASWSLQLRQQMQTLHDRHSEEVIVEAAKSPRFALRSPHRADPFVDFGEWNYPVIIDNMMNLEMLFWASKRHGAIPFNKRRGGPPCRHHDAEPFPRRRQLVPCRELQRRRHGRETGGRSRVVRLPAWARGQAWGLTATRCATARRATRNT